jgi:tRNA modification GTPase
VAAIATSKGSAGLGVLRLSGPGALLTARKRLQEFPDKPLARRLHRCLLRDASGEPLDDVLAVHFPAPRSYTGEEVVEIHCHGGPALLQAALAALLEAGAQPAPAGEFTRRAVANGRMDLLEAEALATLLEADDAETLAAAQRNLRTIAPALRMLRETATRALAEALGAHDHPLETQGEPLRWPITMRQLAADAAALAAAGGSVERHALEGSRIVLLGPPNAGKSSIINALVGSERSLVDEAAGTTRDVVTVPLWLEGRRFTVCDSAGIRLATGVEAAGVAKALQAAAEAEVVVWVEDQAAAPAQPPSGVHVDLRVLTKSDLPPHPSRATGTLRVSAVTGDGLPALRDEVARLAGPSTAAVTTRQQELLDVVAAHLDLARREGPEDLRVAELALAVRALDALCGTGSGAAEAEELVFQRFCIGK